MSNYKIILDEDELDRFIDFLPELQENEGYYVSLFARKKYHPSAQHDKSNLKRFSAKSKTLLKRKLKQFELEDGSFHNRNGLPVHNDALAAYVAINPRCYKKAQKLLLKSVVDVIFDQTNYKDPSSLGMTCFHKSKSRTVYVDFDFDDVEYDINNFDKIINKDAYRILKTRGGFHLLVDPTKVDSTFKKTWHKNIKNLAGCDVAGDSLIPIAGCSQGGYIPRLVK